MSVVCENWTSCFCASQMWCEGVCEMQEGSERLKRLVPTDDVWMAQPVPDSATGGAGFTQQDVGVWALLHQPSWTHKRGDMHTQSWLSHRDNALWGPGSLYAASWKWHVSLRRKRAWKKRGCLLLAGEHINSNNCSWLKWDVHTHVHKASLFQHH